MLTCDLHSMGHGLLSCTCIAWRGWLTEACFTVLVALLPNPAAPMVFKHVSLCVKETSLLCYSVVR